MPNVYRELQLRHNYKIYSDCCKNCKHYNEDTNLADGTYSGTCTVDADPYNSNQKVHILNRPWGVCDEHERSRRRGR